MRNKFRKGVALLATFCMAVMLFAGMGSTEVFADSVSWNFKNSDFKDLGTISSTVTVDGLSLIATSSKTMSVKSEKQTVDGTSYTHCLALGGSGSVSYRAVKVPVSGNDTIKVVLRSSGSSSRTLVVADESGNKLGSITAASSASLGTYSYSGNAGYVYLYSGGSGINIYKIQVDSASGTSSGSSSSSSSSSSSTTVSNYSTISDGWYYIKNVNSQKYLQVTNNSGFDGANVEQGSGTGVAGQKWYLTNVGNGYFTLKNGTGYMLDIPNGENADGTNVQIWSGNGLVPQNFKAVASSKSGAYGILTNASSDTKCLDVYNFSTADGGNVCQWTYGDNTCQQWVFESAGGSSSDSGSSSSGSTDSGSSSSGSTNSGNSSSSTTASSSVSWNFGNSGFKSLGTISSNVTVENLGLIATSSKTMSVTSDSQTVNGTTYSYALALGGGGSTSYRAVKVPVSGSDTIKVTLRSSGTSARALVVADSSGKQLGTITAGTSAALGTYSYLGSAGYVYLYSSGSGINLYKIQVDSVGSTSSGGTSSGGSNSGSTDTGSSSSTDTSDGTVVTSFSTLVSAIDKAESNGGGKVYVKGTKISCTEQIALSTSNANVQIIGVKNSDGTYPVLDFSSFLDSYIGKKTSDTGAGIRISGSKYTIKNLIIEKTPDNGIQIKGSSAGNNTVSNCIIRYCNDAGLQITQGAYSNKIEYVCSYRNCDVYTLGGNADGFAPKLAAGKGNTFYACYAWDNSDDGWDSYDKTDGLTYDLSYTWCACWNNGNPDVFTGKYDFENGASLDTNMLLVKLITQKDSSFANNYKNGKFSLPTSNFIVTEEGTISLSKWTGSSYGGNPNGFKVGSVNTTSSCTRTLKYCLAFDHSSKGFDNNNSSVTAYMSDCVGFDNGYNYYISPFKLKTFSNIVSFSGSSSDKLPSGYSISSTSSSKQSSIRNTVNSTKNSIISSCYANKIPGAVYFDIFD